MKKLLASLLVFCMILGLNACGRTTENQINDPNVATTTTVVNKPTEAIEPTEETISTDGTEGFWGTEPRVETTTPAGSEETRATDATTPSSAFNGKTIEIYGLGDDTSYTDYSEYNGEYEWMMRAAIDEWAEMNGVELVFSGNYDQVKILSAMSAGNCPDVIFHKDKFPEIANVELSASFTDAEYKKLAEICDTSYLDMLNYGTKSHGFVFPWSGNTMCYYNKTLFEKYKVKSPKEYFEADEWTWENFQKCMEEITMDIDADGETDIYGLPGDSLTRCTMVNPFLTDSTGKLINTVDDPMIQDFFQFKYDVFTAKKCVIPSSNNIKTNVDFPIFAMELSQCERYNLEQLYLTLPDGCELEAVPVPTYEDRNLLQWTQDCVSLAITCDERAAAIDMLSYLLKCGMKYMSDSSLGVIQCEYDGIQGTSVVSAKFADAFSGVCANRAKAAEKIKSYDEELIAKMFDSVQSAENYTYQTYIGVTQLTSYSEITQMPPESAIPVIKPKYEAEIQKYNDVYINKS